LPAGSGISGLIFDAGSISPAAVDRTAMKKIRTFSLKSQKRLADRTPNASMEA
jgi:hypothetical protein